MAQLVTESFWEQLLHRNSGPLFKFAFQRLQGVAVTDVHYRVDDVVGGCERAAGTYTDLAERVAGPTSRWGGVQERHS